MIPNTYNEWHRCITVDCKIELTADYVRQRLAVLEDSANPETRQFAARYGTVHLHNVIRWFKQV